LMSQNKPADTFTDIVSHQIVIVFIYTAFYPPWEGKMSSNSFTWVAEGGTLVQLTGVA